MTIKKLAIGLVTAAAVATLALGAHAQTGGTAAGTATKAPATTGKTLPPPAKGDTKKAEPTKKDDAKKASAKGASPCVSLEQAACGTNSSCTWRAAVTRKDGALVKAHCRKK